MDTVFKVEIISDLLLHEEHFRNRSELYFQSEWRTFVFENRTQIIIP